MDTSPIIRFVAAGNLTRDFILAPAGKAWLDVVGGSALYAASGMAIWESNVGIVGRVGEDYPQNWLEKFERYHIDMNGVRILPESLDVRNFVAYSDFETRYTDNPITYFARQDIPFPKALVGYTNRSAITASRNQPTPYTIRPNDVPNSYLDASAAHLCPMDYISHHTLPSRFREGHITTITLDPSPSYMTPTFWDDIRPIVKDLSAFLTSEQKIRALFHGRSTDLWEMAEAIASYGCEIVVIKRGTHGQYIYDQNGRKRWVLPAYPSQMVDPTGAGDAFCGGFLAGFRVTYDALEGALYGNISASLTVESNGPFYALDALPGLARARLETHRPMVRKL